MKIAVPKEVVEGERRVALVPETCKKLIKAGVQIAVQQGAGEAAYFSDDDFRAAGASVESDLEALFAADMVLKVQPPVQPPGEGLHEAERMKSGAMLLTTLYPTRNHDAVRRLAERGVTTFAADAFPRTTRAQAMDVLSSMANIGGYKAVLIAANELGKYFPMFMTAAGTVLAARVFVIGAGVAGLQAIATARRLGAVVEATDTRPVVKEQVESVGGKFVGVDTGQEAQDAGGYAKELSKEFYEKQARLIGERSAANDVVITTALIGGVKAPKLITAEMVEKMRPGSVIVDLAAEAGGNCVLTQPGRTVVHRGVKICGPLNLPAEMPLHASTLYSRNLTAFVLAFCENGAFKLNLDDDILKAATITHGGQVLHAGARESLQASAQPATAQLA